MAIGVSLVAFAAPSLAPLPVSSDHTKAYIIENGVLVADNAYSIADTSNTFLVRIGSGNNNVYVISTTQYAKQYLAVSNQPNVASYNCSVSVPDYGFWRTSSGTNYGQDYIATFPTLEAAYAAIDEYINPAPTTSVLSYDLPCGNIAYISVPVDNVTITLSENMPYLSSVVGTSWKEINQMYGIVTSLPTLGGSVDMTNITHIPWERSTSGATNWLGQTTSATYTFTNTVGGYVVIYNPSVYPTDQSGMTFTTASNNSIHLEVTSAISMRVYATSDDGVLLSNAPTVSWYSDTSSDDDFSSWTDSNGGSSPPTYGGDNILPEEQSIKGLLQKLADEIMGIFEIAWKPIQEIIQSVGGFFEKLADLWSWLPSEVSSLLIAGLTVIVAVGVLKSFL